MKAEEMEGKAIERIFWHGDEGETLCETPNQTLRYHEQYLGDHSECWVLLIRDGTEVARHSTRAIASIVWK